MKGKKYLQGVAFLCMIALTSGFPTFSNTQELTNSLSIENEPTCTKVILKSETPFNVLSSFYSTEPQSRIILEIDKLPPDLDLSSDFSHHALIQDIEAVSEETSRPHIFIDLKKMMPYTIFNDEKSAVIEINNFQTHLTEYPITPEKRETIEEGKNSSIYLKNIQITEAENKIEVKAELTDNPMPNIFVLENPLRLVVDLHNTLTSKNSSNYSINKYGVAHLRTGQFQVSNPYTITRMVFDLEEPVFYKLNQENGSLNISFHSNQEYSFSEPPPESPAETPIPEETKTSSINEGAQNDSSQKKENNSEKSNRENTASSDSQTERLQYEPKTITPEETKYTGQLISPKFKDAELQDVVLVIAEIAGLNVIFDPGVSGTVTCDFTDIPWDQFLDLILKSNKMGKTIEGNVLRIAPISVLMREQEEQQKLEESQEMAGPVLVKTFTLSYSKAEEVQSLLSTKISSRGEIIVDSRTNTLIISDVREKLNLMEKLIEVFDTATPQVSIEARIVEATSRFIRNLGVQWGWKGIADPFFGNQTTLQFPNKILVDGAQIPQGITTKGIGGPLGGYGINLPAPEFAGVTGFSFANITDTFRLDVALSALERTGTGRIISAPKVTTQNNQEAEIIQGRQIPVQTVANFTVTTRYVNAALELRTTPQITAEGTIIMSIEIQNNAADFSNLVNGIPPIIRQSAETTVMVPDGGTAVIGGIYRTEDSITRERIPFLHQIPILGNLFKSFARTKENRELLIFITPRIIR
ncbi:MAG: type IV pilus secretin PilQ [Acidobacteriota bacterium]